MSDGTAQVQGKWAAPRCWKARTWGDQGGTLPSMRSCCGAWARWAEQLQWQQGHWLQVARHVPCSGLGLGSCWEIKQNRQGQNQPGPAEPARSCRWEPRQGPEFKCTGGQRALGWRPQAKLSTALTHNFRISTAAAFSVSCIAALYQSRCQTQAGDPQRAFR